MTDNEFLLKQFEILHEDIKDLRHEIRTELVSIRTNQRIETDEIREDIKDLNEFKFRVYGIASLLSAAITFAISYFKE